MSTLEELTKRARFLRNAAPSVYQEFFAVFCDYPDRKFEALVVTTENLEQAQGHAQQCKAIRDALERAKNG